jgi:hypothetical protein
MNLGKAANERVWVILTDPFNLPAWVEGVIEVRALTTGEFGIGHRFAPLIAFGPLAVRVQQEVTGLWPGQMVGLAGRGPGFGCSITLRLMECPEGTGVDVTVDLDYRAWWARVWGLGDDSRLGRWLEKSLQGLAALAEEKES